MATTAWRRLNRRRDHRWAQSRLSDYVDRELSPREYRRLGAHEEQCPDCPRLIATLQALLILLASCAAPGSGLKVIERTLASIRARIEEWS